ncbi:hypothetical protein C8F01DRAFT_1319366 [Mycena amicta]|nr:hypothetical protein C8F01DRAFT_1319366 [Mycena amicta]
MVLDLVGCKRARIFKYTKQDSEQTQCRLALRCGHAGAADGVWVLETKLLVLKEISDIWEGCAAFVLALSWTLAWTDAFTVLSFALAVSDFPRNVTRDGATLRFCSASTLAAPDDCLSQRCPFSHKFSASVDSLARYSVVSSAAAVRPPIPAHSSGAHRVVRAEVLLDNGVFACNISLAISPSLPDEVILGNDWLSESLLRRQHFPSVRPSLSVELEPQRLAHALPNISRGFNSPSTKLASPALAAADLRTDHLTFVAFCIGISWWPFALSAGSSTTTRRSRSHSKSSLTLPRMPSTKRKADGTPLVPAVEAAFVFGSPAKKHRI